MKDRIARIVFFVSLAAIVLGGVFLWGYDTRHSERWPHGFLRDSRAIMRSLRHYHRIVPQNVMVPAPDQAPDARVAVLDPEQVPAGWVVIMGWDTTTSEYGAWLLDTGGERHHAWRIAYDALDPDGPLNGSREPHAMVVEPDGSLIVGFDHGDAMARLDACSQPTWVRPGIFHHSFDRDDDGTIWTWRGLGTPYGHEHHLVRFDPDSGEILEQIDLIDDIIGGGPLAELVFGTRRSYGFESFERSPKDLEAVDLFHPNDVEVLGAAEAPAFPDFEAGDLLISLRSNDLVAVIGRHDHRPKWWSHGPWIAQHDPDFAPDGWISVFNNNRGRGRSEIVRIDPRTGALANALRDGDLRFHTPTMGKHETLAGGDVLVVIPEEGRVVLTDEDGQRLWEFNNRVEGLERVNAYVCDAAWLAPDFFDETPRCNRP